MGFGCWKNHPWDFGELKLESGSESVSVAMIMRLRLGNSLDNVASRIMLSGLMYGYAYCMRSLEIFQLDDPVCRTAIYLHPLEVLEIFQLDDPAAQRHLSASSGTGAFIPGNSTLIFLGGGSGSLFSRISPSSVSSSISSSANIVIPEGISSLSGSKKYQGITN
nr:hypothetical protein Iba_chr11dCG6710 [Ipomoea batatas]